MTDWREIEGLRKDPAAAAAISARLLKLHLKELDNRETEFLENVIRRVKRARDAKDTNPPLTPRQIEWLVDIRDGMIEFETTPHGFSVAVVIEKCWLVRSDFDENPEDEQFIQSIRGRAVLKKRQLGKLLHIARKFRVIEDYV